MLVRHFDTVDERSHVAVRFGLPLRLFLAVLLLSGCALPLRSGNDLFHRDAILVWHSLPTPEAAALDTVLDRYRRANPGVEVLVQSQEVDLEERYIRAVHSGLGPDLLISRSVSVRPLADAGALRAIDDLISDDLLERFLSVALRTLRYNEQLYGLPAALDTQVLYFNRQLIEQPANTVEQLMQEANSGRRILMNSQFMDAIWSARAFGVNLFDEAGRPQAGIGGIANWLTWMEQVRDTPTFIIDDNVSALRERFLRGDIPYYIGHANELNLLEEALGDALGVAQLPSGPGGSAGPFLTTTALMFNAMSSPRQVERAFDLARFLTGSDQQAALMREANVIPTNVRTRISEGLYPQIAVVTAQARTAIPYFNDASIQEAYAVLAAAYNRTMSGAASATEAAVAAQTLLISEFGFPTAEASVSACTESGALLLLAPDADGSLALLRTLVDGFADVCPNIRVAVQSSGQGGTQALSAAELLANGADLVFLSHRDLPALVESRVIAPVDDLLDVISLQQMRPLAASAMRIGGRVFAAPVFIDVQTLYYNPLLVTDPAGTLADLRSQAQGGAPIVLDGRFEYGFWGVGAFGGQLFAANGDFGLAPTPLRQWLTWLQESQRFFGVEIAVEREDAFDAFLNRRSAYLVASSTRFNELLAQLGNAEVGVTLFPEGPAGPGRPLATVSGLAMVAHRSAQQATLIDRFLDYAAGVQGQSALLAAHRFLPANGAVSLDRRPNVARMAEQLQSATLMQNRPWLEWVFVLGDAAYRSVLVDGVSPEEAVAQMYAALEADADRYGVAIPRPEATPTPAITPSPPVTEEPATPLHTPLEEGTPLPEEQVEEGVAP
ncbi:MAG: extracellular solute-binding protein [Caldilinea sp.]|nr:extracellular solute-binding protein [Caldilinea sp.]MDW8440184.1 extracellular solute-binding protein [Caldilineaceae bacterium]